MYRVNMNTYNLTGIQFYAEQAEELRKVIELRIGVTDDYESELLALSNLFSS